jgi:hypothetical protein
MKPSGRAAAERHHGSLLRRHRSQAARCAALPPKRACGIVHIADPHPPRRTHQTVCPPRPPSIGQSLSTSHVFNFLATSATQ